MRHFCLASLLTLLVVPSVALADEALTLDLPSSRAQAASQATSPAPNPRTSYKPLPSRSAPPRRRATPDRRGLNPRLASEKVIGRLGVSSRTAAIRSSHGSRGRTLARVQAGTYLALTRDAGNWYGVLMADRSTGWIPKGAVNVLEYEVVAPNEPDRRSYQASSGSPNDPLLNAGQQSILRTAYSYLGVPYKWGGVSGNGMDCSAFVQRCFDTLGIRLPRTAHEQINCGMPVSPDQLQAADRLYFASRDGRIVHTGIYIGDGYFIHSSSSRHGVAISRLTEPMYRRMFAGARR